jgi:CheY-like chemotaxis protein
VSKRVLIVEDQADDRLLMSQILEMLLGLECKLTDDGAQALASAREFAYDLVVLDLNLPNMQGWDLVEAFRRMENYRSVPIIAVTGYDRASIRQRTLDAGCNIYLTKPINIDSLVEAITQSLSAS